jgi:hypothetical protein
MTSLEWEECESGAIYAELPDFARLWITEDSGLHTLSLMTVDRAGNYSKTLGTYEKQQDAISHAEHA